MKGNSGVPLSPPPYGYIKNTEDPRFWVIGPEAAAVVRRIYQMALDGYGLAETAAALERDGVFNPTCYWRSKGTSRGGSKSSVEPAKWGHTTVKKILTLQEYCGGIINFKSYSKSYKMKKRIENPAENIVISTTRPHRGAVVQINTPNIIASTGFSVICEIDSRINEEWFLYSLLSNSILQQMLQRSSGGNYPAIVEDEIKKVFLPLVDEKRQLEMVKMLKQNLDELKKSVRRQTPYLLKLKTKFLRPSGYPFQIINHLFLVIKKERTFLNTEFIAIRTAPI